jgi:hypothetical protein
VNPRSLNAWRINLERMTAVVSGRLLLLQKCERVRLTPPEEVS